MKQNVTPDPIPIGMLRAEGQMFKAGNLVPWLPQTQLRVRHKLFGNWHEIGLARLNPQA